MKLFIAKISEEKHVDPIIRNFANYGIVDPVIIDCLGMDDEIKEYNGSILGSLRVMFEKERKPGKIIAVAIKDSQNGYALKAVEQETGDFDSTKENDLCLSIPLDFIKGKK